MLFVDAEDGFHSILFSKGKKVVVHVSGNQQVVAIATRLGCVSAVCMYLYGWVWCGDATDGKNAPCPVIVSPIPRFNSFYFVFFVVVFSVPLGVGVSTLFHCLSLQQLRDLKRKKTSSVSSEGGDDDNALS